MLAGARPGAAPRSYVAVVESVISPNVSNAANRFASAPSGSSRAPLTLAGAWFPIVARSPFSLGVGNN